MNVENVETYEVFSDPSGLLVAKQLVDLNFLAGHIQTTETDGSSTPIQIVNTAESKHIHAVAITDHDHVASSLRARDYALNKNRSVLVIPGSEISSADGHILGINIEADVTAGQTAEKTIAEIHAKGGLAILPHLGQRYISSVSEEKAVALVSSGDEEVRPDGVEVFNGSVASGRNTPVIGRLLYKTDGNERAKVFYEANPQIVAAFGGTDTHNGKIGHVLTGYEGNDPVHALAKGRTVVVFDSNILSLGHTLHDGASSVISMARVHYPGRRKRRQQSVQSMQVIQR